MNLFSEFTVGDVTGGIEPSSPIGILIIAIGILLTVGIPVLMILNGKKD